MTKDVDATLGKLVAEASRDLSALVQAEIKLAKSELRFSVKAGGIGAALFVVAGFLLLMTTILVSVGLAVVLSHWLGAWGYFVMAGVYLLLTALAVVIGIVLLKKVRVPKETIATAREIPATFKRT